MCFKLFTAKYVVGGADSAPPLNGIGLILVNNGNIESQQSFQSIGNYIMYHQLANILKITFKTKIQPEVKQQNLIKFSLSFFFFKKLTKYSSKVLRRNVLLDLKLKFSKYLRSTNPKPKVV